MGRLGKHEENGIMSRLKRALSSWLVMLALVAIVGGLLFGAVLAKSSRMAMANRAKTHYTRYEFRMEVTGYCPCEKCCGKWANYPMSTRTTASGKLLKDLIANGIKFCAADKSVKFGTVFYVPGYGRCSVEDRGGAIKGGKLDLFFPKHSDALAWGRRIIACEQIEK